MMGGRAASTFPASEIFPTSNPNFIRGYGFEGGAGSRDVPRARQPAHRIRRGVQEDRPRRVPAHTSAWAASVRCLPRYENHIDLDPVVKDRWGIPSIRFNYQFGDNEKKMCEDMAATAQEMFETGRLRDHRRQSRGAAPRAGPSTSSARRAWAATEDIRAEPVPAVARRQEPVRGGRQQSRQRVVPEPDLDDHGAGVALVRLPGQRVQEGKPVMAEHDLEISRRQLIKIGAAATVAASLGPHRICRGAAVLRPAKFFTPEEFALVDELSEMIIPTDAQSPGARAAKVAAFIDGSSPKPGMRKTGPTGAPDSRSSIGWHRRRTASHS